MIIFLLALTGRFEAIGVVIALKGIIRYKEIGPDDKGKQFAEYFLIGTMLSLLVVGLVSFVVIKLVGGFCFKI